MCKGALQVLPQQPALLYQELSKTFKVGQHSKRFNRGEKEILFPAGKTETDLFSFDITLCFKVFDNCQQIGYMYQGKCFPPRTLPKYEYDNLPPLINANVSDGMQILKDFRNTIFHRVEPVSLADFHKQWSFLVQVLQLLGYNTMQIADLEKKSLDENAIVQLSKFKATITYLENQVNTHSARTAQDVSVLRSDLKIIQKQINDLDNTTSAALKTNSGDISKLQKSIIDMNQKLDNEIKQHGEQVKFLRSDVDVLKAKDEEKEKRIDSIERKLEVLGDKPEAGTYVFPIHYFEFIILLCNALQFLIQ